jgi:hypothetical protein
MPAGDERITCFERSRRLYGLSLRPVGLGAARIAAAKGIIPAGEGRDRPRMVLQ